MDVVELSRLQFAMTALYHFLFVPLTLGLSVILAIMETVYVMTGRPIWRQMTKFWGTLFGINFVLGVATGITMEFQFGMNWSYYSHYVGDIFGAPLAIEGLMAFFLEATFVGLFFFGWDRLSQRAHLVVTWLIALGANFSALWILIANGWMQNPVGAAFNPMTMRMEMTSFFDVVFNSVAQAKFVHTVSAGYVTASVFVLGVSAWYMLKGRHIDLARRSLAVAASFGLASAFSVVLLGDESGYDVTLNQKMKLAAIEGMWETQPAPASFTLFGFPDQQARETHYALHIPWVDGPHRHALADHPDPRHRPAREDRRRAHPLRPGRLRRADQDPRRQGQRAARTSRRPSRITPPISAMRCCSSAMSTIRCRRPTPMSPRRPPTRSRPSGRCSGPSASWSASASPSSRCSAGSSTSRRSGACASRAPPCGSRWSIVPTPWIAAELGWFVAEYGRQPWVVDGVLPTALAASHLSVFDLLLTLAGFVAFYSILFVIEMALMFKYIRKGPYIDVEATEEWMKSHEGRLAGHELQPAE